jgi:flagellar hook protein FlgE
MVDYVGNLDASLPIGPASQYMNTVQVYDSLGNGHLITLTFEHVGINQWSWTASGTGITVGAYNTGILTYDALGNIVSQTGSIQIDVAALGANSPMDVTLNFSNTTQLATGTTITAGGQNGYPPGVLESFNIGQDGVITGIYSNGSTRAIARIALATFRNPGGLLKIGGSMYQESSNSGIPQIGEAMTGSRGSIISGTLEMSNVDLSKEFTNMIIGQRGFQANSKIITTADEMLQTLVNLKR